MLEKPISVLTEDLEQIAYGRHSSSVAERKFTSHGFYAIGDQLLLIKSEQVKRAKPYHKHIFKGSQPCEWGSVEKAFCLFYV